LFYTDKTEQDMMPDMGNKTEMGSRPVDVMKHWHGACNICQNLRQVKTCKKRRERKAPSITEVTNKGDRVGKGGPRDREGKTVDILRNGKGMS